MFAKARTHGAWYEKGGGVSERSCCSTSDPVRPEGLGASPLGEGEGEGADSSRLGDAAGEGDAPAGKGKDGEGAAVGVGVRGARDSPSAGKARADGTTGGPGTEDAATNAGGRSNGSAAGHTGPSMEGWGPKPPTGAKKGADRVGNPGALTGNTGSPTATPGTSRQVAGDAAGAMPKPGKEGPQGQPRQAGP